MADETKDLTRQELLEQWAEMVRECESRPKDMSVVDWCKQHGVSRDVYYYRKREVVKAGLYKKKKSKSKSKKTTKKTPTIKTVTIEEAITTEAPAVVDTPATTEEPATVAETPNMTVEETVKETVDEEAPAVVEGTQSVTKAPIVETTLTTAKQESTDTLDITIGSAVVHVNDKTSPELLSKVIGIIVPAMKATENTPANDLKEFLAKINIANVTIEQSKEEKENSEEELSEE